MGRYPGKLIGKLVYHVCVELKGERVEAERSGERAWENIARIDREETNCPRSTCELREDRGRELIITRNYRNSARTPGEHLVAVVPEHAEFEAIVVEANHLAAGGGDEAALGRIA